MLTSDDCRVIGLHHTNGARNGKQFDTGCCVVFEIENGRMVSGREPFDLDNWDPVLHRANPGASSAGRAH